MFNGKGLLATLFLAVALAGGGCAGSISKSVTPNPTNFAAPDSTDRSAVSDSYRLGALDTVTVSVFQVPDVTGDYQVDPTGDLNLPLVGRLAARGKTLTELQQMIRKAYGDKYLQDPDVRVEVKNAVSQRITIDGSVNQPGIYPITGDMSLIQAIATAKGTNGDALSSRVVVFRKINGQREAALFDLKRIRRGDMPDPPVYGNDVVVVDGSRARQTYRDIISSLPVFGLFSAVL
ncbi:MAG: polysaccharide biosynthesis/export family protein [Janthinobacterium lividum]